MIEQSIDKYGGLSFCMTKDELEARNALRIYLCVSNPIFNHVRDGELHRKTWSNYR